MDTTKYAQGDQLTIEFVESCPPQKNIGVIVSDAEVTRTQYGEKLSVRVNINNMILKWTMSTTSVKNMQKISANSLEWLSKPVSFTTATGKDGKKQLVGAPVL